MKTKRLLLDDNFFYGGALEMFQSLESHIYKLIEIGRILMKYEKNLANVST